jgi:hypothetical protein
MERKFPRVLSTSPMLGKDGQRRNLCVFEWLNIDGTDNANLTVTLSDGLLMSIQGNAAASTPS